MNAPLRIGISACLMHPDFDRDLFKGKRLLYAEQSMLDWVLRHHALPLMLPLLPAYTEVDYDGILRHMDGLILQGGADLSPTSYGERPLQERWSGDRMRDDYETALIRSAMRNNVPVLGICRGLQMINVALGGSLYQDIGTQLPQARVHRDAQEYDRNFHRIRIEAGSLLERIYAGVRDATIVSVHHQAIKEAGRGLTVEAVSTDDTIIEAVRLTDRDAAFEFLSYGGHPAGDFKDRDVPWVFGVQWHPEFHYGSVLEHELLDSDPLMAEFLSAVVTNRKKRSAQERVRLEST